MNNFNGLCSLYNLHVHTALCSFVLHSPPIFAESPCDGHRHPNRVSSFECRLCWARGWLLAGCMCLNQILKWASLDWGWSSLELGRLKIQGCNCGAVTDPTPLLVLSMTPNPPNFCHHATHCPLDDHCLCLDGSHCLRSRSQLVQLKPCCRASPSSKVKIFNVFVLSLHSLALLQILNPLNQLWHTVRLCSG